MLWWNRFGMFEFSREIYVSFKYSKQLILLTALLACLLPSGCVGPQSGTGITGQNRPAYCITVEELASRLGLAVKQGQAPFRELTNAKNTVRLFMYEGGQAYVNGKSIGLVGTLEQGSTQYVPELLVPKIRASLIPEAPIQSWTPTIPIVTPKTGSGMVVIDPGHGGQDPGAQSVLGYWEKDINLKISRKLIVYLEQAGVTVYPTRTGDTYPTLEERADLANRVNANLFVSIHCDSNGNRVHKGFTIYIARSAGSGSKKAGRLFESKLSDQGISSKGLRKADYRVLVQTKCPAVLVECGFMSNREEAALLMSPWYQDKLARTIADGILEYL